ncbi:MAG: hypothetical protein ABIB79_03095 [archaeon]
MISPIEKELRNSVSKKRIIEMEKYGRMKIYDEISNFLKDDRQTAFSLINHALTIVDDDIDRDSNEERINRATILLNKGFTNERVPLKENWEEYIFKLGEILSKLRKDGFIHAENIFQEIVNYWKIEKRNINRKGKILNSYDLNKLNLEIGRSVGMQFLYILCPELDLKYMKLIASNYGFAVKLADNLSDLEEDLRKGFVNISKENISKNRINLTNLHETDLSPYIEGEFRRVKEYYKKGDEILDNILKQSPSSREGLLFFKEIVCSWLKQLTEIYNL